IGHNDAPFIYEKVGNRFERFMIDEFQDTSVKEWENFLPLLQNAMAQSDATSVVVVGDIKQSIYRWRGGDWKILHTGAQQALGAAETQTVTLQENFRSLPVVVDFNNRAIARIVAADNRLLNAAVDEAAARGDLTAGECAALRDTLADAYRDHAQRPRRQAEHPGYVSVETFADRPPVVERLCELLDKGFRPCDIMILVRGATDGAKVAEELLDFKRRNREERYRFDVMTHEALIIGRAPVSSFVVAALRLALNPDDRLSRAVWNRFLGRAFDAPLDESRRTFFRSLRLLPPEEAFERIVMEHDLQRDKRHTAYLQALHEQIIAFCANKIADIALFLRWWDEQGSARSLSIDESASTIEITTIHKAKGLEKRVVVIPYCSWPLDPRSGGNVQNIVWAEARGEAGAVGRFPVRFKRSMAKSGFAAEYYRELVYTHVDNVNLLYVALTRAAESLHVFVPERGGRHIGSLLLECLAAEADGAGTVAGPEETVGNGTAAGPEETAGRNGTAAAKAEKTAVGNGTAAGPEEMTVGPGTPAAEAAETAVGNETAAPEAAESEAAKTRPGSVRHTLSEAGERFEYGEFAPPVARGGRRQEAEHVVLEHYLTSRADLRLRLPSQRYFDEGERELSPRNFGILMHRAFQEADTAEDIRRCVERMHADGTLGDADAATLQRMIDRALDNPVVGEWFGGGWERVRNEQEIILPGGVTRRPDRVMTRGDRAVVVDYKFGGREAGENRRQIGEYLRLLQGMGYTACEGYLWYVKLGEIEKVGEAC
uniref:UvrD-helicase domain-containing protein n=1 Tax=Alistipes sp. TaxID=1872444 RepID=UPI003AEFD3EC